MLLQPLIHLLHEGLELQAKRNMSTLHMHFGALFYGKCLLRARLVPLRAASASPAAVLFITAALLRNTVEHCSKKPARKPMGENELARGEAGEASGTWLRQLRYSTATLQ